MKFGSLFCGIGGFDLGLERAGMECAWQVEIDPYAQKVLAKHWPNVRRHADVCTFPPQEGDWQVDVICGGFPCQDISYAGKGAGLAGERSGLWHQFARIIGDLRPRYVIVENVAALLTRGMGEVLGTLASLGYDAEWHVIPASAVGAPHRRDRVWIVAYAEGISGRAGLCKGVPQQDGHQSGDRCGNVPDADSRQVRGVKADTGDGGTLSQEESQRIVCRSDGGNDVDYAEGCGRREEHADNGRCSEGSCPQGSCRCRSLLCRDVPDSVRHGSQDFFAAGPAPGTANRIGGDWWATEPNVGRVAHGVPSRVDRLRCLGNAVVPQVVELIGRAIFQHEKANR